MQKRYWDIVESQKGELKVEYAADLSIKQFAKNKSNFLDLNNSEHSMLAF